MHAKDAVKYYLSFKLFGESAFEHFPRIAMDLNFSKNSIASFRYRMENYGRVFVYYYFGSSSRLSCKTFLPKLALMKPKANLR